MLAIQKEYAAHAKRRNELLAEQNRLLEQMIERQARVSLAGLQTEGMDEDGKKLVQTARKIELRTLLAEAEDAGIDVQ
ncbi:No apical meristem-associated C-terminal domain-containing protein [Plasmodiophora brassicae]